MSHPVISQAVEAMGQVGGYEFAHLSDIKAFSYCAPELLNSLAEAFASLANTLAETPAHMSVADLYGQMASGLSGLADAAGEIAPTLEAGNADDFARIDNPRPNEQMADYSVNAG